MTLTKVNASVIDNASLAFDLPFVAGYAYNFAGEDLAVQTYAELILSRNVTIEGEVGKLLTASVGADVIVDVELNGTTIYSTKPTFAAASSTLTAGVLSTTTASAGDRLTFKVTQVGSSTKGQKLMFTLKMRLR